MSASTSTMPSVTSLLANLGLTSAADSAVPQAMESRQAERMVGRIMESSDVVGGAGKERSEQGRGRYPPDKNGAAYRCDSRPDRTYPDPLRPARPRSSHGFLV